MRSRRAYIHTIVILKSCVKIDAKVLEVQFREQLLDNNNDIVIATLRSFYNEMYSYKEEGGEGERYLDLKKYYCIATYVIISYSVALRAQFPWTVSSGVKLKSLAGSHMWWPGVHNEIEKLDVMHVMRQSKLLQNAPLNPRPLAGQTMAMQ